MRFTYLFLFGVVVSAVLLSCGGKSSKKEDPKYDSLFLGFHFGMERQAFYDHCWEYNRKKIFTHGPTNQTVEYYLPTELNSPVTMRFYPIFHNDKIFEMPATYHYDAWAPWNRQFKSDSLLKNIVPLYEKWYGKFQTTDHPEMGRVYYRMDGQRRINLYIKDDQFVRAVFTDLRVERELKKRAEEESKKNTN